jgi:ATP-dependent RNA helicase RhlE
VESLGHVVNFDVPVASDDYIHRVGRTARAEATGEAFTFVSPEEEGELKQIERAIGKQLPRITVPGFDYTAKPQAKLEVPLAERIAEIRKKKADDRARAAAKLARRGGSAPAGGSSRQAAPKSPSRAAPKASPYADSKSATPSSRGGGSSARRGPRRPGRD